MQQNDLKRAKELSKAVGAFKPPARKETPTKVQVVEKPVFYGRPGKDGKNGERGERGPKGERGETGRDGRDGRDAENSTLSADAIAAALNTLSQAIDAKVIKGLPEGFNIKDFKAGGKYQLELRDIKGARLDKPDMNDMRWHGGGISAVSTDTTLTGNGTPSSPLSVVGTTTQSVYGEDLTSQCPSATLVLAHTPIAGTVRFYRGGARQNAAQGDYSITGNTITASSTVVAAECPLVDYSY